MGFRLTGESPNTNIFSTYRAVIRPVNILRPGQYVRHFADDNSRCIFVNDIFCIMTTILLRFVPKGPDDNDTALV